MLQRLPPVTRGTCGTFFSKGGGGQVSFENGNDNTADEDFYKYFLCLCRMTRCFIGGWPIKFFCLDAGSCKVLGL